MAEPQLYDLDAAAAEALSGTVDARTGTRHQSYLADHNDTPSAFAQLMNLGEQSSMRQQTEKDARLNEQMMTGKMDRWA